MAWPLLLKWNTQRWQHEEARIQGSQSLECQELVAFPSAEVFDIAQVRVGELVKVDHFAACGMKYVADEVAACQLLRD
jgi:hypothetical protein